MTPLHWLMLMAAGVVAATLGALLYEAYESWRAQRALRRILKQVKEDTRVMQATGRRW